MKNVSWAMVVLILFSWGSGLYAASPADEFTGGGGTLVLVGGGLEADNADILEAVKASVSELCRKTGRRRPRIGVMPSSKETLAEARDLFASEDPKNPGYRKWLARAGFEPVLVPVTLETVFRKRNAAEDPRCVRLVETCQVIFLLGGDQGRHAISLLRRDGSDSAVLSAIRRLLARGGAVMGTSAGTHVLANPMFGWGQSGPTIRKSRLEAIRLGDVTPEKPVAPAEEGNCVFLPGLGLLPKGVLSDTHFDARGRLGRLVVALRDLGLRWGIGVDENTALFYRNGRGFVRGERGVFLVDTASATFSPVGHPFRVRDLRVSILTTGDSWNAADGSIESTKPLIRPAFSRAIPSSDIFGAVETSDGDRAHPYEATHVMRELLNSREESVVARACPPDSEIRVRFRKTAQTRGFWKSKAAFTVASLSMDIDREAFPEASSDISDSGDPDAASLDRARKIRFLPPPRPRRIPTDDRE